MPYTEVSWILVSICGPSAIIGSATRIQCSVSCRENFGKCTEIGGIDTEFLGVSALTQAPAQAERGGGTLPDLDPPSPLILYWSVEESYVTM